MNKDLPSYEEIPIALEMPENVRKAYEKAENILQKILRSGTGIAQKILSAASEPNPQKCAPKLRTAAMCSASCKARVEQDPVCADGRLCGKRVQALISIRLRRKISA